MIVVASRVIMAGIGLIGMYEGDADDRRVEKLVEKELTRMDEGLLVERKSPHSRVLLRYSVWPR